MYVQYMLYEAVSIGMKLVSHFERVAT
uniref:Uncharacterized protein n=1 Tax=Anguilla anguilla TaxID=7936 RepID=A0A0E9S2U4_ANGAN